MPFVLFYPLDSSANLSNVERHDRFKKSLSEVLTYFYPLAGRVKEKLYVDCNDEGVHYVEAKAECKLSEFLEDPIPSELNKILPFELDDVNGLAIAVQITSFNCGGMVIGLVFDHKVLDACSFFLFLKIWAAIARGSSDITIPRFESATFFPPRTLDIPNPSSEKNKIVVKRFVFDASAIADLKAKYRNDNKNIGNPHPTRVEALSTFIWSRFHATTQSREEPNKVYIVLHMVNLRPRLDPPLSEDNFGNMSVPAVASVIPWDSEVGFYGFIDPVRDAMSQLNMNYVKILQENGGQTSFMKENMEKFIKGEVVCMTFTSLCRFPIYEANFGWGEPIWVGSAKLLYRNLVTFLDTKSGDGIEVWINLEEEDMAKFEVDKELLAYVSPKVSA
jgi:shikimate O-hydroxycinnamoyltransferase